ncbi:unknown [Bacteroides clarus CAG:160]|nr:unknown [Bacteroides clarus CAG:160]
MTDVQMGHQRLYIKSILMFISLKETAHYIGIAACIKLGKRHQKNANMTTIYG